MPSRLACTQVVRTPLQLGTHPPRFTVELPFTTLEVSCKSSLVVHQQDSEADSRSGAFSGILAYGIGHLDYTWGYRGWRFIYVIEGLITFVVGLIAIFTLQDTPAKTKGWLTETDKRFLQLRTRFMYGGGGSKAKDEFQWADVVQAAKVSPFLRNPS